MRSPLCLFLGRECQPAKPVFNSLDNFPQPTFVPRIGKGKVTIDSGKKAMPRLGHFFDIFLI